MFKHGKKNRLVSSEPVNLYITTRVGQVRACESFIEQTGKENNIILLMSSQKDAGLRANMALLAGNGTFADSEECILPDFPASPKGTGRRIGVYKAMKSSLKNLLGRWEGYPVVLHMHHANTYYPYIPRILDELGRVPEKMVLLEEGLASYKWAVAPYDLDVYGAHASESAWDRNSGEAMMAAAHYVGTSAWNLAKAAGKFGSSLVGFGATAVSCITKKDTRLMLISAKDRLIPKRYRFGIVKDFDEGWFCFPEKMEAIGQLSISDLRSLDLGVRQPDDTERSLVEELPKVMFASQRYGEYEPYYEVLLTILEEMGIDKVYIKFHPREDPAQVRRYLAAAQVKHPAVDVVVSPHLDGVPLETLAATGHFDEIIGLTTSSLFYAPMFAPGTKTVSIGKRFAELYPGVREEMMGAPPTKKEVEVFMRDLDTFLNVAGYIEQFESKE